MEVAWVPRPQVWQCPGILLMGSPGFILAGLWVTSTSAQASLQTPQEGPARWVRGRPGRQRGVCCPAVPLEKAAYAEPSGSAGQRAAREAWQLPRERRAAGACAGRKSSGTSPRLSWHSLALDLLPTGPHRTPRKSCTQTASTKC